MHVRRKAHLSMCVSFKADMHFPLVWQRPRVCRMVLLKTANVVLRMSTKILRHF